MLEHSNVRFAILVAVDLLEFHGIPVPRDWSAWMKLAASAESGAADVRDVHEAITSWTP